MKKMIKVWFLEKQGFCPSRIEEINNNEKLVLKETDKAVYLRVFLDDAYDTKLVRDMWVPKSCLTDEAEKAVSPLAYHDYLVKIVRKNNGAIYGDEIIVSGRNKYLPSDFIHQEKSKAIQQLLSDNNIEFMTYKEFKER